MFIFQFVKTFILITLKLFKLFYYHKVDPKAF